LINWLVFNGISTHASQFVHSLNKNNEIKRLPIATLVAID